MEWQWAISISEQLAAQIGSTIKIRLGVVDELKGARVTLFHALILWAWGRILCAHVAARTQSFRSELDEFGSRLAHSKLLTKGGDWSADIDPSVFMHGDWLDD